MIRKFVLAAEAAEPTHLASSPIYSPDHSTSPHINLLDCSASACWLFFFYYLCVVLCSFVFMYICMHGTPQRYFNISSRRIGGCLIRGVPCTSITVAVWFSTDLRLTQAATPATVLWPRPFHHPPASKSQYHCTETQPLFISCPVGFISKTAKC